MSGCQITLRKRIPKVPGIRETRFPAAAGNDFPQAGNKAAAGKIRQPFSLRHS